MPTRSPRLHRSRLDRPGLTPARRGTWLDPDRKPVTDPETLERIGALVIPPAWEDVWVSPDPLGHIQAIGRDAAGRKQYLYHPLWEQRRNRVKFDRALDLAEALPRARRTVTIDLDLEEFPIERALAAAFRIIDVGAFRVGNEEYLHSHGSYGVTTLQCRHVSFEGEGDVARFEFPSKSAQLWRSEIEDPQLTRYLREVSAARADHRRLLAWRDRRWHAISSAEVNEDIRARTGGDFTAKDFRTLAGTITAATALARIGVRERGAKTAITQAVRETAEALGNTPATARNAYIDPRVFDRYLDGRLLRLNGRTPESELLELLR